MIAWSNFIIMLVSLYLFSHLYIKSVGPAALEKKIGPDAYKICARYRLASMIFMFVVMINYIVYYFYPLPIPFPRVFPWPWVVSLIIAVILSIPASYFMIRGLKDAGEESLNPKKDHKMYGGIYTKVRHPQAWEAVFWFVLAFLLDSPMLACISVIGVYVEYRLVMSEEDDLIIRYGKDYEEYQKSVGAFWPRKL